MRAQQTSAIRHILPFGLLFYGCDLCAQAASIAGNAVDSVAHKPLSGVHVRLILQLQGAPAAAYGAMSDAAGHFSIASAPERAGFGYLAAPAIALKATARKSP